MSLIKDIAIVLRRLDYSETSQVLAVLTQQHGQQRLIAKGIKRSTKTRVAVGVDLLEMGEVGFSRRPGAESTLTTMTEWRQLDTFPHVRRDLAKSYAAQYAAEITTNLTEPHDPHPMAFDGFRTMLDAMLEVETLVALNQYLWVFLCEIGLQPDLSRCVSCDTPIDGREPLYFSSRLGGAVCRDCEASVVEKRRISTAVANAIAPRGAHANGGPQYGSDVAKLPLRVFDLLDYHLTETMSKPARSIGLLRSALGAKR